MVRSYIAWGSEAIICFSVLSDDRIDSAITGMDVVGRDWMNSRIQSWKKEVALATRRAALKDDEGDVIIDIYPS